MSARVVAGPNGYVIAIESDDERSRTEVVDIDLRVLRYQSQYAPGEATELTNNHAVVVRTAANTATSKLGVRDGRTTLTQAGGSGGQTRRSAV